MSADNSSGNNQRAFVRQSLSLDASLNTAKSANIQCKIRDFCPGGMFLALVNPQANAEAISFLSRDDKITISFNVELNEARRAFKMQGSIARVFNTGIGAAFINPAEDALKALTLLAEQQKAEATLGRSDLPQERNAKVLDETWFLSAKHLKSLIKTFFEQADEQLFIAARDAKNNVQQSDYFGCMNLLKKKQADISSYFLNEIQETYEQTGQSGQAPDFSNINQSGELKLIEKDDFEDLLTSSEIVSRAEPRYSELLDKIEIRLSQLFNLPMERGTNPLGVSAITSAFSNAKDQIDLSYDTNELLFRVYEESVVPRLEFFFRDLDESLRKYYSLPEKKPETEGWKKPTSKPTRQIDEVVEPLSNTQELSNTADSIPPTGSAVSPQGNTSGQTAATTGAAAVPGQTPLATGTAPATAHPQPAMPSGPGVTGQVDNQLAPRTPAGQTMQAMQNLMNLKQGNFSAVVPTPVAGHAPGMTPHSMPSGSPVGAGAMGGAAPSVAPPLSSSGGGQFGTNPVPAMSTGSEVAGQNTGPASYQQYASEDILEALSVLQRENRSGWKNELGNEDNMSRIKRILKSRVGDDTPIEINQAHANALNMADKFVSSFDVDHLLGSGIKSRLTQMQGTIQKLAIKDGAFLSDEAHPARAVLNQIADLKVAGDSETIEQLDTIVERINQNYDQDANVFAEMMPEISHLAHQQQERYESNVDQVVKQYQQQQELLRKRRGGKSADIDPLANADRQPADWRLWLERAMKMQIGDLLGIKKASENDDCVTLAWIGDNYNPYVFVDANGNKALNMTLQELAMQLRRGTAVLLEKPTLPPVDRAMRTTLYKMHDEIGQQANNEAITGLPNRRHMMEKIKQVQLAVEQTGVDSILAEVNFDCVAAMNRKFGQDAADDLLKSLAKFMREHFPQPLPGCLGGDRFSVLMKDVDKQAAEQQLQSLLEDIKAFRFKWQEQMFTVGASIGLLSLQELDISAEKLLDEVTGAAANAKKQGKNQIYVHTQDEADTGLEEVKKDWRALVEKVVKSESLKLRYQRIVPLHSDSKDKEQYEIILGIEDEDGILIPQEDFLQAAHLNKQSPEIDRMLIRGSLQWMFAHRKTLKDVAVCAIHISELSLCDDKLIEYIIAQLTESRVPAGKVCFEIKQSVVIDNQQEAERFIRTMKEFGCKFSMGGFGQCDTAQGYLNTLPIDFIKMDGLFVRGMHKNPNDLALVRSMNEIGHLMGKKTIADQVNNEKTIESLKDIGVDYIQGLAVAESVVMEEVA